jgi:hypothetical protein
MNPLDISSSGLEQIHLELEARHFELMAETWSVKPPKEGIGSWVMYPKDGSITIVRAESKVKCAAKVLFDYLVTDIDKTCKEWNDVMLYSGIVKKYNETTEISRIISEGNIVADREDVFIRCVKRGENGTLYEFSKGFDETFIPIDTSISKYTVRSQMHFASKEIVPINANECWYKTIWHYDPAGRLSQFFPKKWLGDMILKNLIHEHQKLANIFK